MSSPPVAVPAGSFPPSSRYRHPGDVIRLISAGLLPAAAAAVVVAAGPWLSRPWRRAAWLALLLAAAARLLAGAVLPIELLLALATGVTVGAAVLVTFGVPDRRIGPDGIAAGLRDAGL